jgi:hypothetical protein
MGETLVSILQSPNMPKRTTVQVWVTDNAEFGEMYARARDAGFDVLAEDTIRIIDEEPERVTGEGGGRRDSAYVQWQKNRVELRLRLLKSWCPKRYGDRQVLVGEAENPLTLAFTPETLISLADGLQTERQDGK